jgi:hypothetical protein
MMKPSLIATRVKHNCQCSKRKGPTNQGKTATCHLPLQGGLVSPVATATLQLSFRAKLQEICAAQRSPELVFPTGNQRKQNLDLVVFDTKQRQIC